MNSILILGSTGLIGSYLLQECLDDSNIESVTALVRKPSLAPHPKLKEVVFDFKDESAVTSLKKVNHVFCCLGTTIKTAGSKDAFKFVDYDIPLRFARWAESIKADSYSIVTTMGANSNSSIFYNRVKGEVEDEIKQLNIPTIHIFQPSLILGPRMEFRFGELIGKGIMAILDPLMIGSAKKYRGIHAQTIAKGMLNYLTLEEDGLLTIESDKIGNLP